MKWAQKDGYYMESSTGYRVSKVKTRIGCVYYAWGRVVSRDVLLTRYKAHYGVDDAVPQARELIGIYKTALAAKIACHEAQRDE